MEGKQIFNALQRDAELTDTAAKSGFLQWVLGLPDGVSTRSEAMRVLQDLPDEEMTPSAEAFRGYLQACGWSGSIPKRRRRRRMN